MTSNTPFVGLRPFESRESLLFFGRQEQTIELLQRLHRHHFVAVIGSSGSGKSSLIRAGLIPQLKAGFLVDDRSNWMIAIMKPGQNPLCHLAEALLDQPSGFKNSLTTTELETRIKEKGVDAALEVLEPLWDNNTNFFLLVDQFEELFRFSRNQKEVEKKDEAIDFVNILLQLVKQPDLPLYVLLTMRSDFIGDCAQFFGLPEAMNQSQYLVPRLNRVQLQSIIEDPVKLYGGRISTALTARLLNDLQVMKDELPLLQHALMRIWISDLHNNNNSELNLQDYERIGGIEKALSNHADEAIQGMSAAELGLTKKIFQALTTIDENARKIRRPVRLQELMDVTGATKQQLLTVINRFIEGDKNFLVVNEIENTNDLLIDISHESLIRQWSKLNEWADEESESSKVFLRLTESAELYNRKKGNLLSGTELQQVVQWHNSFRPNKVWANRYNPDFDISILYLKQSKTQWRIEKELKEKERYRKLRNLRLLFALAVAVVIVICFLAYLNYINNIKTHNQLARNYWSNSQTARAENNALQALHYSAEAIGISRNEDLTKGLLIDIQSYLPYMTLDYILLHDDAVYSGVFSPDESMLLTAGYDSTARLWDLSSGKQTGFSMKHQGAVKTAVFSPDGKLVLTASDDGTARLWDAATGKQRGPSLDHGSNVNSAVFNPQGTLVLTAGNDNKARLWEVKSGLQTGPSMQHQDLVNRAVFNPQGSHVVTAGKDSTVRLWEVITGKQIGLMKHKDFVYWADFSPDGKQIVSSGEDFTTKLWDALTCKQIGPDMKHENTVNSAVFSPDGKHILTASDDGSARVWDAVTLMQAGPSMKHDDAVNSAAYSPDGKYILTSGYDKTARLWNAGTGLEHGPFIKQEAIIYNAVFSSGGKRIVTVCGDHTARVWSLRDANPSPGRALKQNGTIYSAVFSADEKLILMASSDSTARIFDAVSGKQTKRLNHQGFVYSAVFSPDETRILTASNDSTVSIWDAKTGIRLGQPIEQNTAILSAVFSQDGKKILTAGTDGTATIWDAVTLKQIGHSFKHNGTVMSAVFSADSKIVLTSGYDSTARQWDPVTGNQIRALIRQQDVVFYAVFSDDNKRIITASADGTARIWDAVSGKQIGLALKHNGPVKRAVFSTDQKWILTASWDNTARLWEVESGKQIGPAFVHEAPVNSAMFSRDKQGILTAGYVGTVGVRMISGDLDLSPQLFSLQARAVTGCELNITTGELQGIPRELWYTLKQRYADNGKAHYLNCKYPQYNLWGFFYPDVAKKIQLGPK